MDEDAPKEFKSAPFDGLADSRDPAEGENMLVYTNHMIEGSYAV